MVLDPHDLLLTSAELSVAFMGFASLVAVFAARGADGLSDRALAALRALIDYGLFALFACAVPFVVVGLPFPEVGIWAFASGAMAVFTILYVALSHRYYREIYVLNVEDKAWLPRLMFFGDQVALLALVGNALGWPYSTSFEVYICAAVFWGLFGAAMSFRGLVAMIWRRD